MVLEEEEWVAHAPEGGLARAELALELRTTGAVFDVSLSGARSWIEAGPGDPVYYVGGDVLRAAVSRAHDVPMLVTAACARDGGAPPALQVLSFAAPQEERKAVELALGADGRHRLSLEGRRLGADERPLERVDLGRELEVIRDTRPPRVELLGWRDGLVLRSAQELAALAFEVRVEDEVFRSEPPPAAVHWALLALQDARAFELASGELPVTPGTAAALPREPIASLSDGRYVLALRATDFTGNQDEQREHPWSVSSEGPRLEVLVPEAGEPWVRTSEVFTVELRAEDANGVARVECELSDEKGALPSRRVALEPLLVPAGATTRWLARFELDHRWAGRRVRLRLRGTDALGTQTLRPVDVACTVGAIPSLVPEYVEVGRPGSASARMRRVPGNPQVAYLFAGRGDYLENAAFRACDLGDYSDRTLTSSLRLECPPGSIADFYLDEHEVSVAQVLAFLRAADGWTDARHWPAGAPEEERRAALERELAAGEPTLPATGLTCVEAQGFASWTGKMLPTYLQWEYAVRGLQARPFSFFDAAEAGAPDLTRVNVGTGVAWPVGRGDDRTPDTNVAELCSNVAEWTSTPALRPLSALSVAELLAPANALPGVRHYVVGGGFDRSVFHFGTIARRKCAEASPAVGFRCMLPAARVEAAFLDQSEDLVVLPVR